MSNVSIQVTACDNELFIIAGKTEKSFLMANIKSGNNKIVNLVLNIENGQFGGTQNVGNPSHNIGTATDPEVRTVYIPEGTYSLIVLGADWGGSDKHFDVSMTGGSPSNFNVNFPKAASGEASGWAPSEIGTFTISGS